MLDPAYQAFLRHHNVAYLPEEPLALSRRAMPTLNALAKHGTVFTPSLLLQ